MVRVIKVNSENKVVRVKHLKDGYKLEEGEFFSESGEMGQIKNGKSFVTPEKVIVEPQPSRLDRIEAKLDSLLATKTQ
jgi:hypothetical protein